MERTKILVAITERGYGGDLVEWMAKRGAGYQIRLTGRGTASSEMMDILGLGSSEKDVVISLGKQSAIESVAREFTDSMNSLRRGRGIMMLLSPNAMGNLAAAILSMQNTTIEKPTVSNVSSATPVLISLKHISPTSTIHLGESSIET